MRDFNEIIAGAKELKAQYDDLRQKINDFVSSDEDEFGRVIGVNVDRDELEIHVFLIKELYRLAEQYGEAVKISDRGDTLYPVEAAFFRDGVKVFAIGESV